MYIYSIPGPMSEVTGGPWVVPEASQITYLTDVEGRFGVFWNNVFEKSELWLAKLVRSIANIASWDGNTNDNPCFFEHGWKSSNPMDRPAVKTMGTWPTGWSLRVLLRFKITNLPDLFQVGVLQTDPSSFFLMYVYRWILAFWAKWWIKLI